MAATATWALKALALSHTEVCSAVVCGTAGGLAEESVRSSCSKRPTALRQNSLCVLPTKQKHSWFVLSASNACSSRRSGVDGTGC